MAKPTDRQTMVNYCLRKLGAPVIKINVTDEQLDDRVDEALKYFWDYHFDGTEKIFYKQKITDEDITNGYITVPDNIIGTINIFQSTTVGSVGMFDIRYQMALNDLYTLTNQSLVPYYINKMQIALYEELLIGMSPIRFNRHTNRVYVDTSWERFRDQYIVIEAYKVVDPADFPDVWSDRWLLKYTTALIKRQWGSNLSKYAGVQLVGGITFDGPRIYQEAEQEIEMLEAEMLDSYSLPSSFLVE